MGRYGAAWPLGGAVSSSMRRYGAVWPLGGAVGALCRLLWGAGEGRCAHYGALWGAMGLAPHGDPPPPLPGLLVRLPRGGVGETPRG